MSDTVTVRVAVVVDEKGDWSAAGWPDCTREAYYLALDGLESDPHVLYWLEAEVETAKADTVSAKAVLDQEDAEDE